jgi:N-acetylmuramoyl-L-alanine amidase
MLDAGHGGIDSGAEHNGITEKAVNLKMSRLVGERLAKAGAQVSFTREDDIDYYTKGKGGKRSDLLKRVEIINSSGADLFISLHCNAAPDSRWRGAQVYYNPSCIDNQDLAVYMQNSLLAFDRENRRREKKDSEILILKNADRTGILIELGFLTNKDDAAVLKDEAKLAEIAAHIVDGVREYLLAKKNKSV